MCDTFQSLEHTPLMGGASLGRRTTFTLNADQVTLLAQSCELLMAIYLVRIVWIDPVEKRHRTSHDDTGRNATHFCCLLRESCGEVPTDIPVLREESDMVS